MKLHSLFFASVLVSFSSAALGQWLNYPTPGIPRTPDGKPNLTAPAPRTADGKPDLTGLWEMERNRPCGPEGCLDQQPSQEFFNIGWSLKEGLPYQPSSAKSVETRRVQNRVADPLNHCLPIGLVRLHTFVGFKKIAQTAGLITILYEYNASYRQILIDGRPLPADPNPSWNGYSIGKWEGDTLVVETIGLRDGLWLDMGGNPLSDAARVTERFRRINYGNLEIAITVDDPKAYTKPWTVKLNQTIKLDSDLLDYVCLENERDARHLVDK